MWELHLLIPPIDWFRSLLLLWIWFSSISRWKYLVAQHQPKITVLRQQFSALQDINSGTPLCIDTLENNFVIKPKLLKYLKKNCCFGSGEYLFSIFSQGCFWLKRKRPINQVYRLAAAGTFWFKGEWVDHGVWYMAISAGSGDILDFRQHTSQGEAGTCITCAFPPRRSADNPAIYDDFDKQI